MESTPRRNIYLKMKTLEESREIWKSETGNLRCAAQLIPTVRSLGKITAKPILARRSVPHYHGAAMDGFAVSARETFGATEVNPLRLEVGKSAFAVDTGDVLPEGTDSVIMIEHVDLVDGVQIEIRSGAFPWQHVRKVGEDIVAGELLLPQNHRLRPADLGALLAAGVLEVTAFRQPVVWIQPTGTELISAENAAEAEPGRIIEFNGTVLAGLVDECGGEPFLRETIPDDYDDIKAFLAQAAASDADVVLINAGSSAGSEDYTAAVIRELGRVLVHGVTMMPGKPTVLGLIKDKPVVGVPGYPVSAIMAFEQFVRPLLFWFRGLPEPAFPEVEAVMGRKMPSRLGLEEFVRVILGSVQGRLVAMPLQRGAGVITSLTRADGLLRIPQELEGLDVGERVPVRLLRSEERLEDTLVMIGSHDNTIDVLANELKRRDSRVHLSSSNVGSLGGLMAVRRGQTHLAGSHLLETDTGEYNFAYVERYLKGVPVRVVQLARRQQGLLIKAGNPLQIHGIDDLIRPEVRFVNRQAGAGTRILFDYFLDRKGLAAESIKGYDQEEYTHMSVAVNVLSGRADCGMAIFAAARALDLDFVPVAEERYDLVVPESSWEDPKIRLVLDIVVSESFRSMVQSMGGYDVANSGRIMGIWDGIRWSGRG
jgi:putative molybdopterin biosynthesis protein